MQIGFDPAGMEYAGAYCNFAPTESFTFGTGTASCTLTIGGSPSFFCELTSGSWAVGVGDAALDMNGDGTIAFTTNNMPFTVNGQNVLTSPTPFNDMYFYVLGPDAANNTGFSMGIGPGTDPAPNQAACCNGWYTVNLGFQAGQFSSVTRKNVNIGFQAGQFNSGAGANNIGISAGQNNSGANTNNMGASAGISNNGSGCNNFGPTAGEFNSGSNTNNIGPTAGAFNSGSNCNNLGILAGEHNSGNNANNIGDGAGAFNSANNVNNFGPFAGQNNTGHDCSHDGASAGLTNAFNYCYTRGPLAACTAANQYMLGTSTNPMSIFNPGGYACIGCTAVPSPAAQKASGAVTGTTLWQGANQALDTVTCSGGGVTCTKTNNAVAFTIPTGAGGVSSIAGTSGQINVNASTGATKLSLPSTLVGIDSIQPDASVTTFYLANFVGFTNLAAPSAPNLYPVTTASSAGYVIYGMSGTAPGNWYGQCLSATSACLAVLGASTGLNFLVCGTAGCTMTPSLTSTTNSFQILGTSGEVLLDLAGNSGDTVFPYASSGTTIVTFGTVGAASSDIQTACNGASCHVFLTANAVQAYYCTTSVCTTQGSVALQDNGNRVLSGTPTCSGGVHCSVSGGALTVTGDGGGTLNFVAFNTAANCGGSATIVSTLFSSKAYQVEFTAGSGSCSAGQIMTLGSSAPSCPNIIVCSAGFTVHPEIGVSFDGFDIIIATALTPGLTYVVQGVCSCL